MHSAPCALVVDDAPATRHRVAVLLHLAGWRVYEAVDVPEAVRAAAQLDPDLVVAELRIRGGGGLAVAHQLRHAGSRARFLFVTTRPTAREHAQAGAWGSTCLPKPIDPRRLVAFLNGRSPRPRAYAVPSTVPAVVGPPPAVEARDEHLGRIRALYVNTLEQRLEDIADSARDGDADAVAAASRRLAIASRQVGHWQLAGICDTVAAHAARGLLLRAQLAELALVASSTRALGATA
jgi:DNA-binding response OmpR family regulator